MKINKALCLVLLLSGSIFSSEFTSNIEGEIVQENNLPEKDPKLGAYIDGEFYSYFSTINYEIKGAIFPFVLIPGGEYDMHTTYWGPEKEVTIIPHPLLVLATPVTQEQWVAITGENPSHFQPEDAWEDLPVESVSYNDVQNFKGLLEDHGFHGFDLPTKEEWEYFARADIKTPYFWGDDENLASKYAWWYSNSAGTTHAVATKPANNWGIYDISGNVWGLTRTFYVNEYRVQCCGGVLQGWDVYRRYVV